MTKTLPKRVWRKRPLIVYALLFIIIVGVLLNFWLDARVTAYINDTPRDPETGIMLKMAPRTLSPENPLGAILLVHGFIGSPSNFADLPEHLAQAQWYVHAMNLPGHGTTPRDFERTSADDLVAGVREKVVELQAKYSPVVLLGHSMGAAIAAIVAQDTPVDGLVLCSPYFNTTVDRVLGMPLGTVAPTLATVIRWIPGRPGQGPVNLEENKQYVDSYGWIPMQGVLTAGEIAERANAAMEGTSLTTPMLLVHSDADEVTSPTAARAVFDAYPGTDKRAVWLTKSDHVIFWDYEAEETATAIVDFLHHIASEAPAGSVDVPSES